MKPQPLRLRRLLMALFASALERRVEGVEVLFVQAILHQGKGLGKALVVHDLPRPQEPQHVLHIRVVAQMDQVFIGGTRFLLCCMCEKTTFSERPVNSDRCVLAAGGPFADFNTVDQ